MIGSYTYTTHLGDRGTDKDSEERKAPRLTVSTLNRC